MLDELFNAVISIVNSILSILPQDPFIQYINAINIPYISYINWFIPVHAIVGITLAWITSIALFYLYQTFLRWIGAIGS